MAAKERKFSAGIWYLGAVGDRFAKQGYRPDRTIEERYHAVAGVKGLAGMEMHYPNEVNEENLDQIKRLASETGLKTVMVAPLLWTEWKWKFGAFTAPDPQARRDAIERAKTTMDIAVELETDGVIYWAAQDGYDYPFQCDYKSHFQRLVDALREVLEHQPKMKMVIEYKPWEPRTHILPGNMGQVLVIVNEVNHPNLGINIDLGHAIMARENLAEAVAMASRYNRLWHTHFNDCFRMADDDLIVGTVNFWETLELLFWLDELGYSGWHGIDIFPYREAPEKALEESIANINFMYGLLDKLDRSQIRQRWQDSDAIKLSQMLRGMLAA